MKLAYFAEICEDITSTRSGNYKRDVIVDIYDQYNELLTQLDKKGAFGITRDDAKDIADEGILPEGNVIERDELLENVTVFTRFITGSKFLDPERKTNFKGNRMRKSAANAFAIDRTRVKELKSELGKTSKAVGEAFDESQSGSTQSTFGTNDVSARNIADVYEQVDRLPDADGDKVREKIVEDLLRDCKSNLEAKWVSFCILGDISMYMGWKTAAKAMAKVYDLSIDNIYRAKRVTYNDFPETLKKYMETGKLDTDIQIGVPFKPMLASAAEIDDIDDDFVGQPKFDGARVLIHSDGNEIRIFSRNQKEVTESFPEVTENLNPEYEYIIDGEIVGYDPLTGSVLPFEKIMNRMHRKNKIEETREEVQARVWLFDCVNRNGVSIDDKPFEDRQEALETVIDDCCPDVSYNEWNGTGIEYIGNGIINHTPSLPDLEEAYQLSTIDHEGIIAKNPNSQFLLERDKSWAKVKPSNTVDLRIYKATRGSGENANRLGQIYLETADGHKVGRVGNGFSDEEREEWDPVDGKDLTGEIAEVLAEEIAITGDEDNPKYGIRFPRLEAMRSDSEAEVDTIDRCIELLN